MGDVTGLASPCVASTARSEMNATKDVRKRRTGELGATEAPAGLKRWLGAVDAEVSTEQPHPSRSAR
jgi:hypothetical protein